MELSIIILIILQKQKLNEMSGRLNTKNLKKLTLNESINNNNAPPKESSKNSKNNPKPVFQKIMKKSKKQENLKLMNILI